VATYEFALKFAVGDADTDPSQFFSALGEAGCTDALVGVGQMGVVGLDFGREASSAREAVGSAIADVKRAIPGAVLIEATPDLVGLTEVADLLGFSRQYMRKLAYSHPRTFPAPIHEGKPSMWHLFTVLRWAKTDRKREVDAALTDLARLTMSVNVAIGEREADRGEVERARALIA
jgi:hypothetical protein